MQLQDVSAGGFSCIGPQGAAIGTRLRLLLNEGEGETASLGAVVRWQRKSSEGFMLGCSYLEEGASRRVERWLASEAVRNGAEASIAGGMAAATTARDLLDSLPTRRMPPLTVEHAARLARRQLAVAAAAIAGSFALLILSPQLGPLGWATTAAAMLGAALATASYHRLTQNVLAEAAEAARQGKLC